LWEKRKESTKRRRPVLIPEGGADKVTSMPWKEIKARSVILRRSPKGSFLQPGRLYRWKENLTLNAAPNRDRRLEPKNKSGAKCA